MVATLHELVLLPRHVVAQVIETEFVVRAVGDVGIVLLATFGRLLAGDDAPDAHAEETVDAAHQLALVAGEIVVDGDDVHALAFERVEVARQRRHEGLAFTGLHLGDVAPVQCRATHKLHVEVTLTQRALGHLSHRRESLRHQVVERLAVGQAFLELGGLPFELVIAHDHHLIFELVHGFGDVFELLDLATFTHTQGFVYDINHIYSLTVFATTLLQ